MRIDGDHWVDGEGRRLVLRGVNLGGDCKLPLRPDGDTRRREGFYEGRDLSFVGRPFPLAEADRHFGRLARWGLDFERLVVTWEAVEHEGPGLYDEAYLDYLEAVVEAAARHGISLFVDPHQDAWSRWSGGDGAPMWTLEAVGFEPARLFESGAAILNQELGPAYPRMIWPSNFDRLACATMFTLFFAGNEFAPGLGPLPRFAPQAGASAGGAGGPSLQDFLQGHYIAAMARIAARLARHANVVGFGSLNEPSAGFIGKASLEARGSVTSMGATPSPWEAILAGSGYPQSVPVYGIRGLGMKKVGTEPLGREGSRAWAEGVDCVWRRAGLWDLVDGRPAILDGARFSTQDGGKAFADRYLKPFFADFAAAVRSAAPGAERFALFVEGVPHEARPTWGPEDPEGVVDATHWYDDLTLVTKKWRGWLAYDTRNDKVVFGRKGKRRWFAETMHEMRRWTAREMSGAPTLLGEFGIPFDMNGARAYRTGDYSLQAKALAATYDAVDESLIDSTLWNYTASNTHEGGDHWNTEDLSVYCRDEDLAGRTETGDPGDSGGRALAGFVRPYARATAGLLLAMRFETRRRIFTMAFRPDPAVAAPTEIFVPALHYPAGFEVSVEGGRATTRLREDGASIVAVEAAAGVTEVRVEVRARASTRSRRAPGRGSGTR